MKVSKARDFGWYRAGSIVLGYGLCGIGQCLPILSANKDTLITFGFMQIDCGTEHGCDPNRSLVACLFATGFLLTIIGLRLIFTEYKIASAFYAFVISCSGPCLHELIGRRYASYSVVDGYAVEPVPNALVVWLFGVGVTGLIIGFGNLFVSLKSRSN